MEGFKRTFVVQNTISVANFTLSRLSYVKDADT